MFHFIEYPRLSNRNANTNPAFMQSIPQKSKKNIYKNKSGSKPLPPKTQNLIAAIENYNLYQQLCLRALLILNTLWYHSLNVLREDFIVSLRIN